MRKISANKISTKECEKTFGKKYLDVVSVKKISEIFQKETNDAFCDFRKQINF